MSQWIKSDDDTKWTCRHCSLTVDEEAWKKVMLTGTRSFPKCTGACEPIGVINPTCQPVAVSPSTKEKTQ